MQNEENNLKKCSEIFSRYMTESQLYVFVRSHHLSEHPSFTFQCRFLHSKMWLFQKKISFFCEHQNWVFENKFHFSNIHIRGHVWPEFYDQTSKNRLQRYNLPQKGRFCPIMRSPGGCMLVTLLKLNAIASIQKDTFFGRLVVKAFCHESFEAAHGQKR